MGLTKYIQGKIKEKVQTYKEDRQFKKQTALEAKQEWRKGYQEGSKKGAYEHGKNVGKGTYVQTTTGHSVAGKVAGFSSGVSKGLNNYDAIFGVSGGGKSGGGFGIGLFNEKPVKQAPTRTTRISPSGAVTITETKALHSESQEWDPWDMGGSRKESKKEKHPYDIF